MMAIIEHLPVMKLDNNITFMHACDNMTMELLNHPLQMSLKVSHKPFSEGVCTCRGPNWTHMVGVQGDCLDYGVDLWAQTHVPIWV